MAILSLGEVPELKNGALKHGYNIHVCDACGGQSFNLEKISDDSSDEIYAFIERFFADRNMTVKYYGKDKSGFTVM